MLEHIGNDVREVFLSDELLLVAKFDDTIGNTAGLFWSEFQTQFLKILQDIRFAGILAQSILSFPAETLWKEVIAVEIVLVVAICMHSCHLCKHTFTNDRLVRRNGNTRKTLNQCRSLTEVLFFNICTRAKMILEHSLHAGQRSIACTLAKSVDGSMHSTATTFHSSKDIACCKVIVIVGMKVKVQLRIARSHLTHEVKGQHGIENAKRIGKHETLNA